MISPKKCKLSSKVAFFFSYLRSFCLSGIKRRCNSAAVKVSTGHSKHHRQASHFLKSTCAGVGVGTLLIALTVRILVTYVCVLFAGFSVREKVFIALAWMPKATVQVCLC